MLDDFCINCGIELKCDDRISNGGTGVCSNKHNIDISFNRIIGIKTIH